MKVSNTLRAVVVLIAILYFLQPVLSLQQLQIPIQWVLTSDGNPLTSFSCTSGAFCGFDANGAPQCCSFLTSCASCDDYFVNEGQADSITSSMIVDGTITNTDINSSTVFAIAGDGTTNFSVTNTDKNLFIKAGTGISVSVDTTTHSITITNTGDTNPSDDITGSGTAGYIPVFTGSQTIGSSSIVESTYHIRTSKYGIVAGGYPRVSVYTTPAFVLHGSTSDYIITVQDGTGRVEHYWNAKPGTSSTYLVSDEPAAKILIHPPATDAKFFKIFWAPSGTAGASITWQEKLALDTSGNLYLSGLANCSLVSTDSTGKLICYSGSTFVDTITADAPIVVTSNTEGNAYNISLDYNTTYFTLDASNNLTLADAYATGSAYDSRFVNEGQADSITSSMIVDGTITPADISMADLNNVYDTRYINEGQTAGGDLNGTYPNPVVEGLLGYPLPSLSTGALYWNGTTWTFQTVDTDPTNELQNVFSNVSDGTNVASADSTADTLTIQGGTGISVTVDSTTDTVTITNTGDTNASDDLTISTTFGGDVSGTYDNLQLNPGVVGTTELADGSVTSSKIADGTIQVADINTTDFNAVYDSRYINEGQTAGGDLSGTYPNPTVAKIQGNPISTTAPSTGQALVWDGSAWSPKTIVTKKIYTTPGVYSVTAPGNCLVYVYLVGGGGTGGNGAASNDLDPGGGGGGGGSGAMVSAILQVSTGETIDVTVGGSDQNSSVSVAGTTILVAGAGGRGADGRSDGIGGSGGSGGTYSINYTDSHLLLIIGAENGLPGVNGTLSGGSGGDSVFINGSLSGSGGSGGAAGTTGVDGSTGGFYGAGGGGGGGSTTGLPGSGGAGAPGVAILTFVCN